MLLTEEEALSPRRRNLGIVQIALVVFIAAIPSSAFPFLIGPKGIAPEGFDDDVIAVGFGAMMSVQVKGKANNEYRLVDLFVKDAGANKKVKMGWIAIQPVKRPAGKMETLLRMEHYSTDDGGIRNVKVQDNAVSFEVLGDHPKYPYKVFCTTNGKWVREIRVTRMLPEYFSEPDSEKVYSEVWEMIAHIALPSLEIWGIDYADPQWSDRSAPTR